MKNVLCLYFSLSTSPTPQLQVTVSYKSVCDTVARGQNLELRSMSSLQLFHLELHGLDKCLHSSEFLYTYLWNGIRIHIRLAKVSTGGGVILKLKKTPPFFSSLFLLYYLYTLWLFSYLFLAMSNREMCLWVGSSSLIVLLHDSEQTKSYSFFHGVSRENFGFGNKRNLRSNLKYFQSFIFHMYKIW